MKRFLKSTFVKFILLTMIFFVVTSPFVVLFGPFDNTKRAVVGAIMRSRHPQYITWLFNQNELNSILGVVNNTEQQKLFDFNIRKDSSLKIQKIESNRFVGHLTALSFITVNICSEKMWARTKRWILSALRIRDS